MKQTEIGLIPDDWEVKELEEICDTSSGGTPSRSNTNFFHGDIKWFTTTELKDCFLYDSIEHISKSAINSSSAKLYPENTLLMAMYGATIGRLGVLKNVAATNQACCAIFPKTTDVMYLFYYLLFKRDEIVAFGSGAGQPNISQNIVRKLLITLPPLVEQQRIAKALSDVDALISTTEKLIQKKKDVKQGTMQNLLTGKKRLPGFGSQTKSPSYKQTELGPIPEDWEVKSIKDFAKVYDGTHQTPHYVDVGIPFYSVENVTANDFEHTKLISEKEHRFLTSKVKIEKGDILMTRIGSIGDCKYVDWEPKASFYVSLALIKCDTSVDARFISYYSNSLQFKKELELRSLITAIPQKINLGPISEIILILPPKDEQTAIANVLSSMDKEIETLNIKLEKYRNLKTAMMQQLLTGKIRLV